MKEKTYEKPQIAVYEAEPAGVLAVSNPLPKNQATSGNYDTPTGYWRVGFGKSSGTGEKPLPD